jgi:CRP/FNR family transcriptional regulator, anaerobic regulatory protein
MSTREPDAEIPREMFVPCTSCSLRTKTLFRPFTEDELEFVFAMKSDHLTVRANTDIIRHGDVGGPVYTLFEGWAARFMNLPDGSRQILDVLLPGDVIGLESAMLGTVTHSVRAITPVSLCVLEGHSLAELFDGHSALGLALLRTRVEEEQRTDSRIAMLGRGTALQRIAYFMLETYDRLQQRGMVNGGTTCPFPLTRRHLADASGLSSVHVARILTELREKKLAVVEGGVLIVFNRAALAALAAYDPVYVAGRRTIL